MKSILILFFLGVSMSVFSQGNFDKRLLVNFSEEQLNDMAANQSSVLTYWTYYLDNSYDLRLRSRSAKAHWNATFRSFGIRYLTVNGFKF